MQTSYSTTQKIGLIAGPLLFAALYLSPNIPPLTQDAQLVVALALLMVTWWITEAIPIAATSLLPMAVLPLLGVSDIKQAAAPYSDPVVYLFMGGFIIALAMEKWNLHRRIALSIVNFTGTNANGILFGFMLATALLSTGISNTATTVMMLPIGLSVIGMLLKDEETAQHEGAKNFALCMMLGIAYSANIGGVATLIGTPPNSVFAGFIRNTYGFEVNFAKWMILGVPFSALMLLATYWVLVKWMYPNKLGEFAESRQVIRSELNKLGPISKAEKYIIFVFSLAGFLWISRSYLATLYPGFPFSDPGIALLAAILVFALPLNFNKGLFLLEWDDTKKLPWGILLLFGGGLSLADAMAKTGLIDLIGNAAASFNHLGNLAVIILLISVMLFMTELMSNVALVTVLLPVVAGIAKGLNLDPLSVMIPLTMASSCAFMLPMGTPPNAIVFASGHIKVAQMVKAGFWLNLVAVAILSLFGGSMVTWVFGPTI